MKPEEIIKLYKTRICYVCRVELCVFGLITMITGSLLLLGM